jgi:hypothetical protein
MSSSSVALDDEGQSKWRHGRSLRGEIMLSRLVLAGGLTSALVGAPQKVAAQGRFHPGIAGQYVSEDGPLGGASGFGFAVSTTSDVTRWLAGTVTFDFAALRKDDEISLCIPIAGGGCLSPPADQGVIGLAAMVELQPPTGGTFHPFVSVGPVYRRTVGAVVPGGRRAWLAPSIEAGARLVVGRNQCLLGLRWRQTDRWVVTDRHSELAIVLGFRL